MDQSRHESVHCLAVKTKWIWAACRGRLYWRDVLGGSGVDFIPHNIVGFVTEDHV